MTGEHRQALKSGWVKRKARGLGIAWNKGKKFSEESRQKMSLAHIGKPSPRKGRKFDIVVSKETRQKLRLVHLGKKHPWAVKYGEDNPNWRGGNHRSERKRLMGQKEYVAWRTAVFERDNYTCQECGRKGLYLEADHIKPWSTHPNLRYEVDNGNTLCNECHRKTPTWGYRLRQTL